MLHSLTVKRPADPIIRLRVVVLACAAALYAWLLSRGTGDLFAADSLGLTFNSMLDHMLQGRWDVDPVSIGFEAFVHDGHSYAYFGPFPALLRLPLVLAPDWQALNVERLSCWLAVILGIAAQTSALMTTLTKIGDPLRIQLAPPLIVICALSGAPMLLSWKGALIYHEAMLWAWALAMLFVALAMPAVQGSRPLGWRRLSALALCAGLCLLTRSTTGAGLFLALGLLMLSELLQHGWNRSPLWAPAFILGAFVVLTGAVNQGRWGSPFVFANLSMQTNLVEQYPDRLVRLQRYALFDWHRLGTGFLYYVLPGWTDRLEQFFPLDARLADQYDAIERPASSLLLTDPAWCLLAVFAVVAMLRRRVSVGEALLAGGLTLAPALMLVAWYLAFRYRAEFEPLLLVLACIGLRAAAGRLASFAPTRLRPLLLLVSLLQVGGAALAGRIYALQPFGPSPGDAALSLRCSLQPTTCLPPRRSPTPSE